MSIVGWLKQGEEGMRVAEAVEERGKANRMKFMLRFSLKPSEITKITFIEDPYFSYNEHIIERGNRSETYVCIQGSRDSEGNILDCPLCQANKRVYAVTMVSLINHGEFVTREGRVYKDRKQYVPFKGKVREHILKLNQEHGGLKYLQFEVQRGMDTKSYNVGEFWRILNNGERVDPKALIKLAPPTETDPKKWLEPFNYEEILEPLSPKELYAVLGINAVFGSQDHVDNETPLDSDKSPKRGRTLI
jgi:hypothetical protein